MYFSGSNSYGIKNISIIDTIEAVNCYWGDASGPNDLVNNPGGSGDKVIGNVAYQPFANSEFLCSEEVLPVTLLNFKAVNLGKTINCIWQTASETNSNYFIVQRSTDCFHFSDIGSVTAYGNSNTIHSYNFYDNAFSIPVASKLFYRLQEVDKDGKKQLSNTAFIDLKNIISQISVYPNPAKDVININLQQPLSQSAIIILYDMNGKKVMQKIPVINSLQQQLRINTLHQGNYNLIITDNGKNIYSSRIKILN